MINQEVIRQNNSLAKQSPDSFGSYLYSHRALTDDELLNEKKKIQKALSEHISSRRFGGEGVVGLVFIILSIQDVLSSEQSVRDLLSTNSNTFFLILGVICILLYCRYEREFGITEGLYKNRLYVIERIELERH